MSWSYFHFENIRYAIRAQGLPDSLRRRLYAYTPKGKETLDLELILCTSPWELPKNNVQITSGVYKGVPWDFRQSRDESRGLDRIHFYAPFFTPFLVTRLVLIPYMKKKIVTGGGFTFIGAAFRLHGKRMVLFGDPGGGKTKLLLEGAEQEGEIFGDSEIAVTKNGIKGLFSAIELRHGSIRKSPYWKKLTGAQQRSLNFYRWLSGFTLRKISLNIAVPPEQLGIKRCLKSLSEPKYFIYLDKKADKMEEIDSNTVLTAVTAYTERYQKNYGKVFFNDDDFRKEKFAIKEFLGQCSIWRVPADTKLEALLKL